VASETTEIRQAIAETRAQLGETVQALAQKADVKAQVAKRVEKRVEEAKEQVKRRPQLPIGSLAIFFGLVTWWRLARRRRRTVARKSDGA
jgi:DNA-binding XRE family transcriptional regulator